MTSTNAETKQALEPDSNMANIFKVSDWEFKISKINMLRALMEKADNMQEQMINVAEKKEILRKGLADGGVMNWEIGIDIYTLICIKWITSKNLLYKKINNILKFKKKREMIDIKTL